MPNTEQIILRLNCSTYFPTVPKCAPFVGKVIVDDVWSGGTAEEAKEKGYLLMSECIKDGLYHPNCQDSHTTYFGDIDDEENTEEQEQTEEEPKEETPETEPEEDEGKEIPPTKEPEYSASENGVDSTVPTSENQITPQEQRINEQLYNAEQRQNYCERQVQRFERLGKYSLDKDNQRIYRARKSEWKEKLAQVKESIQNFKKSIAKSAESGIIELTRKKGNNAQLESSISDKRFNELTIEARLTGAKIIRDDPWFNARMEEQNASAITYGDVLVFGKNATVSDVIEETYHYKQNLQGLNADKPHELRIILNEIDAKKYLIDNAKKFKIPRGETELTKEQLKNYEEQLQDWYKRR